MRQVLAEMVLDVDLVFWDERLTTEQAEQILIASGRSRRDRQARVDAVAAAAILQSYLDR
jgi:putative Holliday junction resolvase